MSPENGSQPVSGPTIAQMARQSGLSEHALRYYERIGLLRPIPRDRSSGHRRYAPDTVARVESLACLRGTGMSIEEMRRHLELLGQGHAAASEQKALFEAHRAVVARELEAVRARLAYLEGKIAYWSAVEAGDETGAQAASEANRRLASAVVGHTRQPQTMP